MFDTIDIRLTSKQILSEDGLDVVDRYIVSNIYINGDLIVCEYVDCLAFMVSIGDNRHVFEREIGVQYSGVSDFYPFSCSCGIAGCSGIYQGVNSRHRRNSVEWRIVSDLGYHFLSKRFYRFDRKLYDGMLLKIWKWLHEEDMCCDVYSCMSVSDFSYLSGICK